MLEYILILLDSDAPSFCYYKNGTTGEASPGLIPLPMLGRVVDYCTKHNLIPHFLYGKDPLPQEHQNLIDQVQHVKILPLSLKEQYDAGVFVVDSDDQSLRDLSQCYVENLILRLRKEDLGNFHDIFRKISRAFKRLNLYLLDLDQYTEEDIHEYENQLSAVTKDILEIYLNRQSVEVNFLSDRLMLQHMNNCDAGIKHLTIAPNGKFYLCPGFYYDDEQNAIGDLQGIEIKNGRLLQLENAPICRKCDAFHCKRCVYLNRKTTLEVNVPSLQQCETAHLERNSSKYIREQLDPTLGSFTQFAPIPELPYLDPLELVNQKNLMKNWPSEVEHSGELESLNDRQLLTEIYQMQKEILRRLAKC